MLCTDWGRVEGREGKGGMRPVMSVERREITIMRMLIRSDEITKLLTTDYVREKGLLNRRISLGEQWSYPFCA